MATTEQLLAVSPVDGRYGNEVADLQTITSEFGLMKRRIEVSARWVGTLGVFSAIGRRNRLSDRAVTGLMDIGDNFSIKDAHEIKAIEGKTKHDVNAVVRWLKEKLAADPAYEGYDELVHYARTSEDINNLAYAMMVRDARDEVLVPQALDIEGDLRNKAGSWSDIPMLAHTHGQPAVPTTLGKEMAVFAERLSISTHALGNVAIYGKLNGASGNYNADTFANPDFDWESLSKLFIRQLGFEFNPVTTQIEPHDWIVRFCNELGLNNSIMNDLSQDMWTYISKKYLAQEVDPDQDGSSAMPQKINPIDFENAWSNFDGASDVLQGLARKLPVSRLQRDLSDSSSLRRLGEAFGHTVIAHKSVMRGLGKVHPNHVEIAKDLDSEWGVLAEPLQTIMRKHGASGAYDVIKEATRGKGLDRESYLSIVDNLSGIPEEDVQRLRELSPATYIGLAAELASRAAD